jgi:antagonist of KipI
VPVGGAADRAALALGNALVGNGPDAAALEVTLAGPTLQADCDLACVVYGAPFELAGDRPGLTAGTTFTLAAGERLHIRGTRVGLRAYLCVRGGLQTDAVLGSRSGLAPLAAGAVLPCQPGVIRRRRLPPDRVPRWPRGGLPDYVRPWTRLRVLDGPQAVWFGARGLYEPAEDEVPALPPRFTVTPASNRMGLRLRGAPLAVPDRELVSEPVCPGTVQVTRDGQCILLGVDGQTIGGYPKVAQVIAADLDLLGQLRPGEQVAFVRVGLEEAEGLYRRRQAHLHEWLVRLRVSLDG